MTVDRGTFIKLMAASPMMGAMLAASSAQAAPAAPAPPSGGLDPQSAFEALRLTDAWLTVDAAYHDIPALAVGVVSGNALVWAKGYGAAGEAPVDASTPFRIGSVSKLFASIAVMQEVAAGRLALDAPLDRALPWARPSRGITLRHLLSHRSGLDRDVGPVWTLPEFRAPTVAELTKAYRERPLLFAPGTRHHYSNLGMSIAGMAAERSSGLDFDAYVRQRIAEPIGMKDTTAALPSGKTPKGFSAQDLLRRRQEMPPFDAKAYAPAGGVTSTVADLAKFASWIFERRRSGDSVVTPMLVAQADPIPFIRTYGLGFHLRDLQGETLVGHFGEVPGFRAEFWLHLPTETGLIVLRNASGAAFTYSDAIFSILGRRRGPQFPAGHAPLSPEALEAYVGRYSEAPWGAEGVIVPWAGGLAYLSLPNARPGEELALFRPAEPDLFRLVLPNGMDGEPIRFQRNADGRVTGFVQNDNLRPRVQ